MLSLRQGFVRDCEGIHRRDFMRIGALAGMGLSLADWSLARKAAAAQATPTTDVNCILIWTRGGTSHIDTFDPKPLAPADIRGEFSPIRTSVAGVHFSEVVPGLAKEFQRFSILRGWNPNNAGHGVADQVVMSGHDLNPAIIYPCYGSVISHYRGFKSKMPPFIQIIDNVNRDFGAGTSGYLGLQHNPFELYTDPNANPFVVRDVTPPAGIDGTRIDRRRQMLSKIESLQRGADAQPAAFESLDLHIQTAFNMITSPETKQAFEIDREDPGLRDRYGRSTFGQSCLLARRLIEAGVRFVTIADPGQWDTHGDNFNGHRRLCPPVDKAIPELLADLEARGMLQTTLVLWLTDFGRTPKINAAAGRDHHATAGCVLAAGAGIPGGTIVGETDSEANRVLRDEYSTKDIGATVYSKLGIPLDLVTHTPDGRPIRLNEGRVIRQWM